MTSQAPVIVQNRSGLVGVLADPESLTGSSGGMVSVRLTSGRAVLVPVDLLVALPDGSFRLDLNDTDFAELDSAEEMTVTDRDGIERDAAAEVIPVIAETVEVTKREVESGRVRVHKSVATTEQVVTESLVHHDVEVERVPVNRVVDQATGNRQEGDTLVVPVFQEVLVVEKRLMLVEEIRITRRKTEQQFSQTVPLRVETVEVEQVETAQNSAL